MKKLILIIILLPSLLFGQNIDQFKGKKLNDLNDTELELLLNKHKIMVTHWIKLKH